MDDIVEHGTVIRADTSASAWTISLPTRPISSASSKGDGVIVTTVEKGSPANKAGIQVNDIVTSVNGKEVKNMGELRRNVSALHPGEKVELAILRGGKSMNVDGDRRQAARRIRRIRASRKKRRELPSSRCSSASASPISTRNTGRSWSSRRTSRECSCTEVESGTPAEEEGLDRGDVIVAFNLKPVANLAAFKALVKGMKADKFMLTVYRGGAQTNIVIKE